MNNEQRTVIGTVTETERDEIEIIFERLNSLRSICLVFADKKDIFDENNHFYDKVIKDLASTQKAFDSWWNQILKKYRLDDSINKNKVQLDFYTMELYYISGSKCSC